MTVNPNQPWPTGASTASGGPTDGEQGQIQTQNIQTQNKAQETAQEAQGQAKQVGETAKDQAANVAQEAKQQGQDLLAEARAQITEQSRGQRDRVVSLLHGFGQDLEKMSDNAPEGMARDFTRQAAARARALGDRMDGREPGDLVEDVRRFARRRPGTFLLGAAIAGVAVGRLTRGAKQAHDQDNSGVQASGTGQETWQPGVGEPGVTPPTTAPLVEPPVPEATAEPQVAVRDEFVQQPAEGLHTRPETDLPGSRP